MTMCRIVEEQPLGDDRAEAAPTDDDHVEVASRITEDQRCAIDGLLKGVRKIPAHGVERKGGVLGRERLRHGAPRLLCRSFLSNG